MARGRKRKQGKRTPSGQLSRKGAVRYDHGTERAQAIRAIYGGNASDAIGRAYEMNMLGPKDSQDAKDMLAAARKLAATYWQWYEVGGVESTLGKQVKPERVANDTEAAPVLTDQEKQERDEARERRMTEQLKEVAEYRPAFDELAIDIHPDSGPAWLDRLIADRFETDEDNIRTMFAVKQDQARLDMALDGLRKIALNSVDRARKFC